jgi:hypothetical protein
MQNYKEHGIELQVLGGKNYAFMTRVSDPDIGSGSA